MLKEFKTSNVVVRKFELKDVKQAHLNFFNGNNCNSTANTIGNEMFQCENFEQARLIVKSAIKEYYTDEPIWAVEDKHKKKLVGFIRVSSYSKKNKICSITWNMCCEYLEKHSMSEAFNKIFNFLFLKKGVELIECSYYEHNSSTGIVLEEAGMIKEAVLRDRRVNEQTNEKENFVIYSISKQEFLRNSGVEELKFFG